MVEELGMIHMIFVKSLVLLYFENPGSGKIVISVPEFVLLLFCCILNLSAVHNALKLE